MADPSEITGFVSSALAAVADAGAAPAMAAYMKTDMPFYGVKKPQRVGIRRELVRRYPPPSHRDYVAIVGALWALPHREEKYLAIAYARAFPGYVDAGSTSLYRRMVVEGAWWDFVDEVAAHLVGGALLGDRQVVAPVLDGWIGDENLWLRRTAILAQLRHRDRTDEERLFSYCLRCADEKEFFIRKAIGWALREYSKTAPDAVRAFVLGNRDRWSGLTFREATRHLDPGGS
jgi:3-methyladenine DNA glycosylase AlkD